MCLVDWFCLSGRLVFCLSGRLVLCLSVRLVLCLFGRLVLCLFDRLDLCLFGRLVLCLSGRLVFSNEDYDVEEILWNYYIAKYTNTDFTKFCPCWYYSSLNAVTMC